jgi:hypothetical protein
VLVFTTNFVVICWETTGKEYRRIGSESCRHYYWRELHMEDPACAKALRQDWPWHGMAGMKLTKNSNSLGQRGWKTLVDTGL